MAQRDFVHTPLSRAGAVIHWLLGESSTRVIQGPSRTRTLVLRSDHQADWPRGTVTCSRIVYKTIYRRPWIPSTTHSLYHVEMHVPDEVRARYPAEYFESVTYPLLCNPWLEWTTYPHLCAIHAYLDTFLERLRGDYEPYLR